MSGAYVYTPVERASRRLGFLLLFVIGVVLMVGLFYVKTRAQAAKDRVAQLERQIEREQAAIDVLRAERALLTNPARLAELSDDRLGLTAISTEQTITLKDLLEGEGAQ